MVKNIIGYCAIILLCNFTTNCWSAGTSTDRMSLVKNSKIDISKQNHYTIKVYYPKIYNIPHDKALNQLIQQLLQKNIHAFHENLSKNKNVQPIESLPWNQNSNTLTIDYKIMSATPHTVSIRFSIDTFFYGAAHPFVTFQSLNYDVDQGRELYLKDMFNSPRYLQMISDYAKKQLTEKLSTAAATPTQPEASGIKPVIDNYLIWNITPKGLLFTFPPYQVAAYVFGPQEILVPYSLLLHSLKRHYE